VVAAPLEVVAGLTLPQPPALPQLRLQLTPEFVLSLTTVAVKLPVALTARVAVAGETLTVRPPPPPPLPPDDGLIVTTALAEMLGSATEAAVSVTVPPVGTVAGAM
jgi:hypothetical protein